MLTYQNQNVKSRFILTLDTKNNIPTIMGLLDMGAMAILKF